MNLLRKGTSLPMQLVFVLVCSVFFGEKLPIEITEFFYSLSLLIKAGLFFVLPWIIFSFMYSSILEIQLRGAFSTIFLILVLICISNFISTMVAFSIASVFGAFNTHFESVILGTYDKLNVLFALDLKPFVSVENALLFGITAGLISKVLDGKTERLLRLSRKIRSGSNIFLNRVFVPIIPLFVLGFSLQLQHENAISILFGKYSIQLGIILIVYVSYLGFLYAVASNGSLQKLRNILSSMFPAIMSGFTSMSSMVALPLTLKASERNSENPSLARVIVPLAVNNHLVGDSIFIPFIGLLLATESQNVQVEFGQFIIFAFYFVMAKFAVAAVPGGGILVMIPVLERHLGLDSEMLSLITALYVLFDPLITSANVAGNGAFALLVSRLTRKLSS